MFILFSNKFHLYIFNIIIFIYEIIKIKRDCIRFQVPFTNNKEVQIYVVQKTRIAKIYIKPNKDIQKDYRMRSKRALFFPKTMYMLFRNLTLGGQ